MSRDYALDLTSCRRVIVGEGESDHAFWRAFCAANHISGFEFAFAGILNGEYSPSGFDVFGRFLSALGMLAGFSNLTDVVLICDSAHDQDNRMRQLKRQVKAANRTLAGQVFDENPSANIVAQQGQPRLHVLLIPENAPGGLETLCVDVARDHLNEGGSEGSEIEGWVNTFADCACVEWTVEKRDKLRLQAFISAAWKKKPDMHLSQLFDITRDRLVPLTGGAFDHPRNFLRSVEAL